MIEKKIRPPFGFKTKRFIALGYHPHFETRPGTFKYPNLFPGCYDSKVKRKIISKVPGWKRQQEIEEFCRKLSFRGEKILKELQWMKSVNGPGWQDVPSYIPQYGVKFPKSTRFPIETQKFFAVPGPGTYGKNHNPYERLEDKSRGKGFSFSNVPSFEHSGLGSRSLSSERSYHLPPNLYNIKSCTDELLSKRISKKGPYQLFTTERFPRGGVDNLSALTLPINPLSLNHPRNAYKGHFYKCGKDSVVTSRITLKDPTLASQKGYNIGPGSYNPYPIPTVRQACAPFNSSVLEARPTVKCGLSPPAGRYDPIGKKRILGDGMKSVFLSKTKRDLFKVRKESWFNV